MMVTNTSDENKTTNSLAANASQNSRKRALDLFSKSNHSSQHVPPLIVDSNLYKTNVARRVRLQYPILPIVDTFDGEHEKSAAKEKKSMTARVLEELREEKLKQIQSNETSPEDANKEEATSGQIVIHREVDITVGNNNNSGSTKIPVATSLHGQEIIVVPSANTKNPSTSSQTNRNSSESKKINNSDGILVKKSSITNVSVPTPTWHAPWKLSTVISSHLGWVRSIAFDPTNEMFATGSADRTIKIFDFVKACVGDESALKITLTGHISPIRGLAFSPRHPYLFSAGEDKMVKCWDLETNQVVRHYHGHLSGVFDLKLHPTLDILVTGGRDAVARVWDMRTKQQVHVLTGHDNTVGAILTKGTDPQIITGSYDSTVKLWDLAAGKCMSTLTHHKKSIRTLVQPSFENSFMSGAADTLKKWHGAEGRFIKNFTGHKSVINTLAMNDDGVLVSGADNGTMNFWDYKTGYCFQKHETIAQPGSLDAENGIFTSQFDLTGTRLITGEADKTIKIWKQDDTASELSHPVDMIGWRKKCLAEAKKRV